MNFYENLKHLKGKTYDDEQYTKHLKVTIETFYIYTLLKHVYIFNFQTY